MGDIIIKGIDQIRKSGFRPEVVGCFVCSGKLLFLYKREHDLWQFPQGGINNHETPAGALVREMTEELEDDFIDNCADRAFYFYSDKIVFRENKADPRRLLDDSGKPIGMRGKHYLFFHIAAGREEISIGKTDFDDYKWCSYRECTEVIGAIYQAGKKRIYSGAVKHLKELNLLN